MEHDSVEANEVIAEKVSIPDRDSRLLEPDALLSLYEISESQVSIPDRDSRLLEPSPLN